MVLHKAIVHIAVKKYYIVKNAVEVIIYYHTLVIVLAAEYIVSKNCHMSL